MADRTAQLKHTRDRAILLLRSWRGFRSDELSRLDVDFMQLTPNEGLELFLPFSKGDRKSRGEVFKVPALANLCPVEAVEAWLAISGIQSGPLFRGANRWGHLSLKGLHSGSFLFKVNQESKNSAPKHHIPSEILTLSGFQREVRLNAEKVTGPLFARVIYATNHLG